MRSRLFFWGVVRSLDSTESNCDPGHEPAESSGPACSRGVTIPRSAESRPRTTWALARFLAHEDVRQAR